MLIEKIKEEVNLLMKGENAERKEFLKVVIGELNRGSSKNPSDAEVMSVLKSMRQSAEITGNDFEISVIDEYLPKNLTEDEVKKIVDQIVSENNINDPSKIGMLMGKLKQHEKVQFIDNKFVATYFRSLF